MQHGEERFNVIRIKTGRRMGFTFVAPIRRTAKNALRNAEYLLCNAHAHYAAGFIAGYFTGRE